jgi:hypothetical protein
MLNRGAPSPTAAPKADSDPAPLVAM